MAIDIGAEAVDRGSLFGLNYTIIDLNNPANESGTITAIEIFASAYLSGCKVGTFSKDGTNFTCHDYETVGNVTPGKQICFMNIACTVGDYIGIYFSDGNIERDTSGYAGVYWKVGDQFEAGEQSYVLSEGDAISVYGTNSYAAGGTYYFNAQSTTVWTDAVMMINTSLTNYAYTSSDGATEILNGNNCPGTNLGTITKVEIRTYGYGDGDDRIDLTPVFSAGDGDEHQTTPGASPGSWGAYQDITSDTNHPSPWTWSAVQAIDCKVEKDTVAKGNQMNCAKVEIRVTYTPTGGGVTRSYGFIF